MPPKPPDPEPLLARLNPRQRTFAIAYWESGHATEAATLAGYAWPAKQGSRLNSRPDIRAVLRALGDRLRWEHHQEMRRRVAEGAREIEAMINSGKGRRRRRRR